MKIVTKSPSETIALGKRLSRHLPAGSVVALRGNLGAGKTTFVKGLAEGLGIRRRLVTSPSFVLVKEYRGTRPLYHFDLYRIHDAADVFDVGYEEYLSRGGIVVIEWSERIQPFLPKQYLEVKFAFRDVNERLLTLRAHGALYRGALKRL